MRRCAIIEAPSILGLKPTGVETLPDTLLANGLAERLNARRAARVEAPPYRADRDPVTLTLNDRAISHYSIRLADAIGAVLDNGEFPVVLGGDCSILLGSMLALRRRGHYGLLLSMDTRISINRRPIRMEKRPRWTWRLQAVGVPPYSPR